MFEVPVLLVLIVVVALIFDFTNGAHDCANAIATVVSTKVLSPRVAVVMAASLNFIGAFLGTKVATTLGAGIVNTDMVANCQPLVLAALLGAIAWNLITWYFGIPSSSSHALIGGLMGAAVAYAGFSTLNGASIAEKILLPLILSPLAGFGMGFLTMFLIMLLCARANRNKLTRAFTKLQIVSAAFMATSHGLNDAQKTMGVITLALFIFNKIDTIAVPFWVKCVCSPWRWARRSAAGRSSRRWATRSSSWSPCTVSPPRPPRQPSSVGRRFSVRPSAPPTPSPPASSASARPSGSPPSAGAWPGTSSLHGFSPSPPPPSSPPSPFGA